MGPNEAYDLLGLKPGSDRASVKAAFRAQARLHHPDRNPGDSGSVARFTRYKEAYDLLMTISPVSDPRPVNSPSGISVKGADLDVPVTVTLEQVAGLRPVVLRGTPAGDCPGCVGKGWVSTKEPLACSGCDGKGSQLVSKGIIRVKVPCSSCGGMGTVHKASCRRCSATGRDPIGPGLSLSLPYGTESGEVVTFEARGAPGKGGGSPGDLNLRVTVDRHPVFVRRGADLLMTLEVSFADLCLGGSADIDTLNGERVTFEVPAGTSAGGTITLPGRGLRDRAGKPGDLVVRLLPRVPATLTDEQRDAMLSWRGSGA